MNIKRFESISKNYDLIGKYGEKVISECDEIISYINDLLIDLNDLNIEYYVNIDYSPFTYSLFNKNPEIFCNISIIKKEIILEKLEIYNIYKGVSNYLKLNESIIIKSERISMHNIFDANWIIEYNQTN